MSLFGAPWRAGISRVTRLRSIERPLHKDVVENSSKRQVKAPKVYVRDSGIPHSLLGVEVKRADAPTLTPSMSSALQDLQLHFESNLPVVGFRPRRTDEVFKVNDLRPTVWFEHLVSDPEQPAPKRTS
jgi:hypothetical protein